MGVLYSAFPIDSEVRDWLAEERIDCPETDGRAPTPNELARALDALSGFNVDYNISDGVWQAQVDDSTDPQNGMWTLVNVMQPTGADDPCKFYFEKGSPELIVQILHHLSAITGPFALVPDTGCPSLVVAPDSDVQFLLSSWEHLTGG
jgi:hypothetical protein